MSSLFALIFIFLLIFILINCVVIKISYSAMKRMVVPNEHMRKGGHRAGLLAEVRPKLLACPDVCEVEFKTFDNLKLNGLFIKRKNAKGNLLLCHGIHSIKEFMFLFIDMMPDYNILMFDFRAHGQSEGDLITVGFNESKDVVSAANFLKKLTCDENKKLPLVITGFSMGASSALRAVARYPEICDAIIADSAFRSLNEIVYESFHVRAKGLPRFPFFYFIKLVFYFVSKINTNSVLPLEDVKQINKPILFIHSVDDSVVPNKNSINLFEYAVHDKSRLWIGPSCQHARLHNTYFSSYKNKVVSFLQCALD